jgi:threonine dehydrogenase-like Zn-dependent dehydrogenase
MAEIEPGDTVVVFGCGPVGQFAIASAKLMDAGRIFAVDHIPSRLDMARAQGAEAINFDEEHPIEVLMELTGGIGADRAIDAVGIDAQQPHSGPAAKEAKAQSSEFKKEVNEIAPNTHPKNGNWEPGDGPSQVLDWAVKSLAKAGTLSIIGVYPMSAKTFPIGMAMNRNLSLNMGNCHHRKYLPNLVRMVSSGVIDPSTVITQVEPLTDVIEAYKAFDKRQAGWIKVELLPAGAAARA